VTRVADTALHAANFRFANSGRRPARFKHGAQVLALLNRPNIAIIHGDAPSGYASRAVVRESFGNIGPAAAEFIMVELKNRERFVSRLEEWRLP
jgi:hypothetical protein